MKILFNKEARQTLQKGVNTVVDTVKITLGPRGQNVIMGTDGYSPTITNDGVSIAKSIKLEDKLENMGADIAKEAAIRTDMVAGDGTTTTLILLQEIINNGIDKINTGVNVIKLNEGIREAAEKIAKRITEKAIKINNLDDLIKTALISVENEHLANLVATIVWTTGLEGSISVVESDRIDVEVEQVDAYQIDIGFANPYVINNYHKMIGEYSNIPVLVTDKKIFDPEAFLDARGDGIIKRLAMNGHNTLLLIADDIDGPALQTFYLNASKQTFTVIPIRFKVFGEGRLSELEDIALFCGTKVIGDKSGIPLDKNLDLSELGLIGNVEISVDKTRLYGGEDMSQRINDLEELLKNTDKKEIIKKRIANLSQKTAVVKVGALTDIERKYLKLKIDDAINACRGALEMGVVAGGGYALFQESENLYISEDDKLIGENILIYSLKAPYLQLLKNSGIEYTGKGKAYNATTDKFVDDLIKEGVVDPVKVTTTALLNAASAASTILTVGATTYE